MSHPVEIDPILLSKVSKPARYVGGEWNSVVKDHDAVKLTVAYCFPDVYEVAMSHLGLTCPLIGMPLKINGSSRRRLTLMVMLLSTKLELSQKVFDKFKVLTTMRVSHSYLCLSLSESC